MQQHFNNIEVRDLYFPFLKLEISVVYTTLVNIWCALGHFQATNTNSFIIIQYSVWRAGSLLLWNHRSIAVALIFWFRSSWNNLNFKCAKVIPNCLDPRKANLPMLFYPLHCASQWDEESCDHRTLFSSCKTANGLVVLYTVVLSLTTSHKQSTRTVFLL